MPQGPIASSVAKSPANALVPMLTDSQGALISSARHGKYFEGAAGALSGWAANQAGLTTSAGLAPTYLGICLSNPAGSGKKLVVQRMSGQFIVAPSTVTGLGMIVGYAAGGITAHTTALTPGNNLIGNSAAALVGLVDSACTLVGTPAWRKWFAETLVATDLPAFDADIDGEVVLPPGAYCAIGTTIAGPASGFQGAISWEEVAL